MLNEQKHQKEFEILKSIADYCNEKLQNNWHLGTDDSLLWHNHQNELEPQIIIYTKDKVSMVSKPPFETSLFFVQEKNFPNEENIKNIDGVLVLSLEMALLKASADFYKKYPDDIFHLLNKVNIKDLVSICAKNNETNHVGHIFGALKHFEIKDKAEKLQKLLVKLNIPFTEKNPFVNEQAPTILPWNAVHPFYVKLSSMWSSMRDDVLAYAPKNDIKKNDKETMENVNSIYSTDAYHSLTIEGYRVDEEIISKTSSNNWKPNSETDKDNTDLLATYGYHKAFQKVRSNIEEVLKGTPANIVAIDNFHAWRSALFEPAVEVGIIHSSDLLGYRNSIVLIGNSRHVPPHQSLVYGAIAQWRELLKEEKDPFVQAVLGHFFLGYIHPFSDGNGRTSRFLMNCLLSGGNYPWTVIKHQDKNAYISSLEKGSTYGDIRDFAKFISDNVKQNILLNENKETDAKLKQFKNKLKPF